MYYFDYFDCCCAFDLRKKASPGTRSVYNYTTGFDLKRNTRNFYQIISLFVCPFARAREFKNLVLRVLFCHPFSNNNSFLKYELDSLISLSNYSSVILRNQINSVKLYSSCNLRQIRRNPNVLAI